MTLTEAVWSKNRKSWASKMFDRMNDSYLICLGAEQGVLYKLTFQLQVAF